MTSTWRILTLFAVLTIPIELMAQEAQIGVLYKCTNGQSGLKIAQCTGGSPDLCDVELYKDGKALPRLQLPKSSVNDLLRLCLGATSQANPTPNSPPSANVGQADANGFKIGDTVSVATAGGWYAAQILRANGDAYFVRLGPSLEVWKSYPSELRRIGPLTDVDKARGLFSLHEKVQVNFEGRWVDSEILAEMGMEYQVALPGNRTGWTSAQNLRRVSVAEKPPAPGPGQPPRPGLTSCAGKIEGRYASSGPGFPLTIVFKSGKATIRGMGGDDEEVECWMSGRKIFLHKPGETDDVPIDINDDGTLDTPMGEIKKKGA
jgi:hypothetical protein